MKKDNHVRVPAYGHIVKQSEYFPMYFLVYFMNEKKYLYSTDKVVRYVSVIPATTQVSISRSNMEINMSLTQLQSNS